MPPNEHQDQPPAPRRAFQRLRRLPAQLMRRSPFRGTIQPGRVPLLTLSRRPALPFPHPWNYRESLRILKTFYHRADGGLAGHNVRLEQNGLDAPDRVRMRDGVPFEFGYFGVRRTDASTPWCPEGIDAALLDYGLGHNPPLDPSAVLRDPLVAVNDGDSRLLLGYSYVQLGPVRFGTPTFFVLSLP